MAKSFQVLREKMTPAQRAAAELRYQELVRELPLDELREARDMTQEHLAKILRVKQSAVSKMERRADMYVSTLESFVGALGGKLEIRAVFPEGAVRISRFGDLAAKKG